MICAWSWAGAVTTPAGWASTTESRSRRTSRGRGRSMSRSRSKGGRAVLGRPANSIYVPTKHETH